MGTGPEFASQAEAAEAVLAGLGYLAALDLTQLPACAQAELLRILEQAHAMETAARAQGLRAFTSGQGYHEDACYGAKSWLTSHLGVAKGAATAYVSWARRADAHPRVIAALAAREISESVARTICDWTGKLPPTARTPPTPSCSPPPCPGPPCRTWPGWPPRSTPGPAPRTATGRPTGSMTGRSGWRQPSKAPGSWAAI